MDIVGFEWDRGNRSKCQKHGVSHETIEELFDSPLAVFPDEIHSGSEQRYRAVGWTKDKRAVFVAFTLREQKDGMRIRPISARYMHKKEIRAYEKENPDL